MTFNSSLVPFIEGLCISNLWEFEFSGFRRNRSDDLGSNSSSLWPAEPRLHVRVVGVLGFVLRALAERMLRAVATPNRWEKQKLFSWKIRLRSTALRRHFLCKSWSDSKVVHDFNIWTDSPLHFDIRNIAFYCAALLEQCYTCLPRQDHIWITTHNLFTVQKNRWNAL